MLEDNGVQFTNLNGQTVSFNNATWPLKEFEVEGTMKANRVDRMQEPGEWPTRTIQGATLIHCGGDLLLSTASAYIAERIRVLNILVPPGVINDERPSGVLTITYTDLEPMIADVALDDYPQLPMKALYPSVTEFSITFRNFSGIFVGRNSGRFYNI